MLKAIFYKEVSTFDGEKIRTEMQRQEIETGKETIEDAYLVALQHGHNPFKLITYVDY